MKKAILGFFLVLSLMFSVNCAFAQDETAEVKVQCNCEKCIKENCGCLRGEKCNCKECNCGKCNCEKCKCGEKCTCGKDCKCGCKKKNKFLKFFSKKSKCDCGCDCEKEDKIKCNCENEEE